MKKLMILMLLCISNLYASEHIGFKNFEIYKVKKNLHSFRVIDIDEDGLKDIAYIDNNDASIALMYQNTPKEAKAFKKEFQKNKEEFDVNKLSYNFKYKNIPFIVEKSITAMEIIDLGRGKKKDLVYLTNKGELYIQYQTQKRSFTEFEMFKIPDYLASEYALVVKDVNADKKPDIILLGKSYLYVFQAKAKQMLTTPKKYPYSSKDPLGIEVNDVNGDGLNDIIFVASGGMNQIRVKFQLKDHRLGPDHIIEYPDFHFLTTKKILNDKRNQFISSRAGAHVIFIDELTKIKSKKKIKPLVFSLSPESSSENKHVLFSDFNNDGWKDFIVSDPILPYFMFFKGGKLGFNHYIEYPAPKGVTSIFSHQVKNQQKLIAYSKEDKSLFVYDMKTQKTQFLMAKGDILGVTTSQNGLFWILEREGEKFLEKFTLSKKNQVQVLYSRKLQDIPAEFDNFLVAKINKDQLEDLVFIIPYEGARFWVSKGYVYEPLKVEVKKIHNLLSGLTIDKIKFLPNAKKQSNIILSNKGVIFILSYDEKIGLKIEKQFNGMTLDSDLTLPVENNIFSTNKEMTFFDKNNTKLYTVNKNSTKITNEYIIKGIDVNQIHSVHTNKDKKKELVLLGNNSVFIYDASQLGYQLKNKISHRLNKKKAVASVMDIGFFQGKKLVSIDGVEHTLTMFKIEKNKLVNKLRFKVFESMSYRSRGNSKNEEPKHLMVEDMNKDGLDDIILYVHDKLLIYYQE